MRLHRRLVSWLLVAAAFIALGLTWMKLDMGVHRVDNGSMHPTLPVGSLVIIYKTDSLERLDMITYRDEKKGGVTTHTFLGYNEDGTLITHGDANPTIDPRLDKDLVVGKVWRGITTPMIIMVSVALILFVLISMIPVKPDEENPTQQEAPPAREPAPNPA